MSHKYFIKLRILRNSTCKILRAKFYMLLARIARVTNKYSRQRNVHYFMNRQKSDINKRFTVRL